MEVVMAMVETGMGLCGGKKKLVSLYWRLRAEIRRQFGARKQRYSFHYDPFSYALNFDDGCSAFLC